MAGPSRPRNKVPVTGSRHASQIRSKMMLHRANMGIQLNVDVTFG
jgi:hypothetical protein